MPCRSSRARKGGVKSQRGFTLIELIISITLVSAISAGMLMAMRTSLMTLEKVRTRLDDNRRAAGLERMVTRQLGEAMPMRGDCATSGPGAIPVSIFNGTPQWLYMVSGYSMTEGARGYPRFLEYLVAPDQGGTVRLLVNEKLYAGPATSVPFCLNTIFSPAGPGPESFVVAERLAYCRISYQERDPTTGLGLKWVDTWNRPELPAGIRIEMAPATLDPQARAVSVVTVSLHITREPEVVYADQ
jgi:prepilin-type N-terminal cleavage/methylation domain-containing protein